MNRRVLIVEDEQDIAELLKLHLADVAQELSVAADGYAGLQHVSNSKWDLVVLDLRLPGVDGLEICRHLRTQEHYTPVLMLTARSTELDRIHGLDIGADDYLTKPFSVRELVARARAIFRRSDALRDSGQHAANSLKVDALTIEVDSRTVALEGSEVLLTAKEFDLLLYFARHPGIVYTRAQLLDQVWGYGHDGYEHTVNSHINRLRAKIEPDPSSPTYIDTVWGVGYRFHAH
jgi:DNA-binding response OmpR family regulator